MEALLSIAGRYRM